MGLLRRWVHVCLKCVVNFYEDSILVTSMKTVYCHDNVCLFIAMTTACCFSARQGPGVLLCGRREEGLGHRAALRHPRKEGLLLRRRQPRRLGDAHRQGKAACCSACPDTVCLWRLVIWSNVWCWALVIVSARHWCDVMMIVGSWLSYSLIVVITSEAEGRASFRWIWEFSQVERPTDRPTDRDAFQRPISFEPSYRLTNGFRHLKATFNKSFVLAL